MLAIKRTKSLKGCLCKIFTKKFLDHERVTIRFLKKLKYVRQFDPAEWPTIANIYILTYIQIHILEPQMED